MSPLSVITTHQNEYRNLTMLKLVSQVTYTVRVQRKRITEKTLFEAQLAVGYGYVRFGHASLCLSSGYKPTINLDGYFQR